MGIGAILLEHGLISADDLDRALAEQKSTGERLDKTLIRMGLVEPSQVTRAISEQFDLPMVDLAEMAIEDDVLACIPRQIVFRQQCVPIERLPAIKGVTGSVPALRIATCDPFDHSVFDELRLLTGCHIELALAEEEDLRQFIRARYGVGGDTLEELSRDISDSDPERSESESDEAAAHEASVIRLVNELLAEAIASRATDVHIEPYEHRLIVRYRIDGVLQRANVSSAINRFTSAIVSRIKIMSSMNIAEKRKPQDGRITLKRSGQSFDLRVSIIPMLFGEGVVLRILNKSAVLLGLDELGMPGAILERWDTAISKPHGILLVTGPTGSGKSTTLYASLNRIISDEIKAITVEDPVEYHVQGVNQIQVNHKVGMDFSAGLRAILRHDPDVIMIGEIRDRETAEAAVQASLTGHLVFSTLHTNDAAGAMPRMLDMGVEPYLVSSSIEGVLAQRLVRCICEHCREEYSPSPADLPEDFEHSPGQMLARGGGCRQCFNTGYRGRKGVYELLRMTEPIRDMVMRRANASEIAREALASGDLNLLRHDGYDKARAGMTTIDEVMRIARA